MTTLRRVPISGWQRCVHEAASFESGGEFKAACLLDAAKVIEWWLRNDPLLFRIPTPIGYFEPDFVYRIRRANTVAMGILEIKGEIYWDGDGSAARIKAATACAWVRAIQESGAAEQWEFAVVLDQDAREASSLESMLANAQRRGP
jgi:hypothetical protein